MSEMVERVARVVAKARRCDGDPKSAMAKTGLPCPFCRWGEDAEEESGCVFWAEQIIGALREPTESMIDHGAKECGPVDSRFESSKDCAPQVWRAMIDAVLK